MIKGTLGILKVVGSRGQGHTQGCRSKELRSHTTLWVQGVKVTARLWVQGSWSHTRLWVQGVMVTHEVVGRRS